MPRISIVCPLYNKRNYIKDTLNSVFQQTVDDWELIIVDDGSTDGSFEIATNLCRHESRIKFLQRRNFNANNRGANICRNIGAEQASGEFVLFLDADDLLTPFCVEQRLSHASRNPGHHLYIFNVAYFKGKAGIPYAKEKPTDADVKKYKKAKDVRTHFLRLFLKFDLPWHTSGPLWQRDFFLSTGGFDPAFQRLQDPELHSRILMNTRIKVCYAMTETKFDVLHRNDDSRTIWSKIEFLEMRLDAISQYINTFVPVIEKLCPSTYVNDLQGYLIEADKLVYRYLRESDNKDSVKWAKERLTVLHKEKNVQKVINGRYRCYWFLYTTFTKRTFIKTKLAGAFTNLYRNLI